MTSAVKRPLTFSLLRFGGDGVRIDVNTFTLEKTTALASAANTDQSLTPDPIARANG